MKVRIPQPCHEDWNAMRPAGQGRRCDSCSKTVVDFTAMSDSGIAEYLAVSSGICGRFRQEQLDRELVPLIPTVSASRIYAMAACGILTLSPYVSQATEQTISRTGADTIRSVPAALNRGIFHFQFEGDSLPGGQIAGVRLTFGIFTIDTLPGQGGRLSIHIPDSVVWDKIEVTMTGQEGMESACSIDAEEWRKIQPVFTLIRIQRINGLWTPLFLHFGEIGTEPPFIMGLPYQPPELLPERFWQTEQVKAVSVTTGFVLMGDTVAVDSQDKREDEVSALPKVIKKDRPERRGGIPAFRIAFVSVLLIAAWLWLKRRYVRK